MFRFGIFDAMKIKPASPTRTEALQLLMERFSMLTDRANFLKQRCSGLGRMECQTLQLLERYRQSKPEIQERIRRRELSDEEITLHLPRSMRQDYVNGSLASELIDELPRDLSMKALADEIGVACSRMTRIGDTLSDEIDPVSQQMRGKGMIHRGPSPDDRRVILIGITEKGTEKVESQGGQNSRIAELMIEKLGPVDLPVVEQGLSLYLKALEEILPQMAEELPGDDSDCNINT